MPHAVSRLRAACMAHCTTLPHLDRNGKTRKPRCERCRLAPSHCMCALQPVVPTRAGVCLLMASHEALKPTNTGWLIADVVPDTTAYLWSRTAVDPALLAQLADPQWQPYVVFPGEFVEPGRVRSTLLDDAGANGSPAATPGKRPLFILLDGTWTEARKIFRKSPYLDRFPVLSLQPEQLSRYRLRRSTQAQHFCTSEVAALCLELSGEEQAARTLEAYLDVFTSRYLRAKISQPVDAGDEAHERLASLGQRETMPWVHPTER